jgi:hypothetical protein
MTDGITPAAISATHVTMREDQPLADVTCRTMPDGDLKCSVSDYQLNRIRERIAPGSVRHIIEKRRTTADEKTRRAKSPIWRGITAAFKLFPIIKQKFYSRVSYKMLTAENIVAVIEGNSGATSSNHNELRDDYKSSSLSPKKARKRGVVAMEVPIHPRCPKSYDWEGSASYYDVSSCQDVIDEIKSSKKLPVVMFATKMPWQSAITYLADPDIAPLFTRYSNDGPIPCTPDTARDSAYHLMRVSPGISVDFIMRNIVGKRYIAWEMQKSCTTIDGEEREPDDLMFNFGPHIFETLSVDVDGKVEDRTLTLSTVAATSTNFFSAFVPDHVPYHRFIGGAYAKMLLLEAKYKGWKIEQD